MDRQKLFDDLFDPLYAALPDSGKYLERIGMAPVIKTDKETLDAIVFAHQSSIPFENLDIYDMEAELSIGIPELFDKLVSRRRGGYCFELNSAFIALLKSLGFDCYAVAIRVIWNYTRYMPLTHMGAIVTIEGTRYFCDVGFGGPSPQSALFLDETGMQPSGPNVFVFTKSEDGTVISRIVDGKNEPLLSFLETPCDPVDLLALHEWQSRNSRSMFKNERLCNLVTKTGVITLGGNVLRIHDNDSVVEKTLNTEDDIRCALKEYYGIVADFPLNVSE